MVRVKNKELVKSLRQDGVNFVVLRRVAEHHAHEVLASVQAVIRVHERLASTCAVRVGSQHGNLRHQAIGVEFLHIRVERVERILVVGGQHVQRRSNNGHGV